MARPESIKPLILQLQGRKIWFSIRKEFNGGSLIVGILNASTQEEYKELSNFILQCMWGHVRNSTWSSHHSNTPNLKYF